MKKNYKFQRLLHISGRLILLISLFTPALSVPNGLGAGESVPPLRQELWVPNGVVMDVALSGNTLFIGGAFDRIGPPTGGWVGLDPADGARRGDLPRVAGSVFSMISDGSGGWFLGGDFMAVDGIPRDNLAHIQADGSLDLSWNPGANDTVRALVLGGSTLYIGGDFNDLDGQSRTRLGAVNVVTGAVSSWAPSLWHTISNASVYALAYSGGTVYAGGYFDMAGGAARSNLATFDAGSGSVLPGWVPDPNSSVSALLVIDNLLYVGGMFNTIAGTTRNLLAALDVTTGAAAAWDPNASGGIFPRVSAFHPIGDLLYVGGQFTQIGGKARNSIAALDLATGIANDWDPNASMISDYATIYTIVVDEGTVYVGGRFRQIGGQSRNYLAALDETTAGATAWDPNPGAPVSTVTVASDTVFAGGGFTMLGGVSREKVAALDLATGEPTDWNPSVVGSWVWTLALDGSTLYLGGIISQVGGQSRNNIAAVDTNTGSVTDWNPDSNNTVYAIVPSGNVIFVGGSFIQIGGAYRFTLAALDASSGIATGWSVDTNGPDVRTLALAGNTLYVGGGFTTIGGVGRSHAAAVDATTAAVLGWNPAIDDSEYPYVTAFELDGNTVYIGGRFGLVGGLERSNLAAVDALSGIPSDWNPGVGGYIGFYESPSVSDLAISGDTLFVGGQFTQVAGQDRRNLAALDASSAELRLWDPGAIHSISALALDGGTVYAGGAFSAAAGQPQAYVAAIATVTAETDPASQITSSSATLNGTITAYSDPQTTALFEWGTDPGDYSNVVIASPNPVNSSDPVAVSAPLSGLVSGMRIYYRLKATTTGGEEIYGAERSFTVGEPTYLPIILR
jgi:trimeric autotransporter adhesin